MIADGGPWKQINEEEPNSKSLGVPDEEEEHVITENTDELNALGADDTSRNEPEFPQLRGMWIESWVVMLIWFKQSRKTTGRCCHGCVIRLILMPTRPPP